jgi:hypothetical protein
VAERERDRERERERERERAREREIVASGAAAAAAMLMYEREGAGEGEGDVEREAEISQTCPSWRLQKMRITGFTSSLTRSCSPLVTSLLQRRWCSRLRLHRRALMALLALLGSASLTRKHRWTNS